MTMLGGMGTLYGPMLGAGAFFGVKELLLPVTEQWQAVLGVLFVLVVIFVPEGLVSIPATVQARFAGGPGGGSPVEEPEPVDREVGD